MYLKRANQNFKSYYHYYNELFSKFSLIIFKFDLKDIKFLQV